LLGGKAHELNTSVMVIAAILLAKMIFVG